MAANPFKGVAPVYVWLLLMDCREAYQVREECPACKAFSVDPSRFCASCPFDSIMINQGRFSDDTCTRWGRETLRLLDACVREGE